MDVKKTAYVLKNPPNIETKIGQNGAEMISFNEFTLEKTEINNIKTSEWFVFTEYKDGKENLCLYEDGTFLFLCIKNNHDGDSLEVTTLTDITSEEANVLVNRLVMLIDNYVEKESN